MKVLGPCVAAAATWEVAAGAEALEEADEVGVVPEPEAEPEAEPDAEPDEVDAAPEAVLDSEAVKVIPTASHNC